MRGATALLVGLTDGWESPVRQVLPPRKPRSDIGKPHKYPRNARPRKQYVVTVPRKRKIPREVRQQLYQLELTRRETVAEIRRIFDSFDLKKDGRNKQMQRIVDERGE